MRIVHRQAKEKVGKWSLSLFIYLYLLKKIGMSLAAAAMLREWREKKLEQETGKKVVSRDNYLAKPQNKLLKNE